MPRNHAPGPSTLRNRNRVTNKTRLRVIKGNVEGDPLAFDEDEERARVVSTAGVDAEDANEHHLQAVLSAASVRHQQNVLRATRGADKPEKSEKPDAFIPIPDNTGLVDGWEEFYPVTRGAEPVSFIKTSATAEEAITDALTDGFTYYMDERDKEWLDKNNEDARGEGTSAQGSISTPSTRTSQRSAKAKGKEPDVAPPTPITEDEFELVMGVFERVTHEKTPFLHHGLTERSILPFSDYQDTFATPLQSSIFAVFVVPAWIPQPAQLSRIAKTIYPYWKERRIERGGHRIIPTLNYDEADVKNESYICFRRRDVKAMRKTRASQASSSEKLIRLQQELATVHELSMNLCKREELKRELLQYNQAVWEGREKFVDLKRKFPSLLSKDDEELLVDKERPPKRPKALEQKIKIPAKLPKDNAAHSAVGDEVPVKPKDKYRKIAKDIEDRYQAARERDLMWDDGLDNSYQAAPPLLGHRLYKFVQEQPEEERPGEPTYRAVRTRRGRGGVLRFDRRSTRSRPLRDEDFISSSRRSSESTDLGEDEAREQAWRLRTQWMHDVDDEPHVGPDGPDEQDRVLIDEWSLTTMRKTMRLITEQDSIALQSDPTLHWTLLDGTDKSETPFKIGAGFQSRREQHLAQQQAQQQAQQAQALRQQQQAKALAQQAASRQQGTPGPSQQGQLPAQQANGIPNTQASPPMSTTPIRRSSSAMGMPVRISSTGPMRPPATPTAPPIPATPTHASPPHPSGSPAHSDPPHLSTAPTSLPQDLPPSTGDSASSLSVPPILAKTTSHPSITMPNGFHMNGYNPLSNGVPLSSSQQVGMQQLSAYMNMNINGSRPAAYIGPNSVNYSVPAMNLKLPAARQIQWTASQAQGVPNPPPNVTIAHSRTQAALVNGGHASPPRTSQSPSIQHQQVVGSTSGY